MPSLTYALALIAAVALTPAPGAAAAGLGAHEPEPRDCLCGRVLDPSGAAVSDARVALRSGQVVAATATAADGRFRFDDVGAGPSELEAEKAGFAQVALEVATEAFGCEHEVEVSFALPHVTESVSVTADRGRDRALAAVASRREDFELRNNRRVGDVLRRMPGVLMSGAAGEDNDVRLRGLDKEFTRTAFDGFQLPDPGEKREFQVGRLSSFMAGTVRVLRSTPASTESDGIAGRIEVEPRPIPSRFEGEARVSYGGPGSLDGGLRGASLGVGLRPRAELGALGAFDQLESTTLRPKLKTFSTGRLESEDETERSVSRNVFADLGLFLGSHELHLKPLLLEDTKDKSKARLLAAPGTAATREEEAEDAHQQTSGLSLSHRWTAPSGARWEARAARYVTSEEKDKQRASLKQAGGSFALDKTTFESEDKQDGTWNASASGGRPFGAHDLRLGAALRLRDRDRHKRKLEVDRAGRSKDTTGPKDVYGLSERYLALFAEDGVQLGRKLVVLGGVRLERVGLDAQARAGSPESARSTDVNPSLQLAFAGGSNVKLHLAAGRSVTRPKFDELSPFEEEAATRITVGNPELQPSRAWSLDGGGQYTRRGLTLGANVFHRRIRGLIESVDTGLDQRGKDLYRTENVGDGWTRGLELEQRLDLSALGVSRLGKLVLWANESVLRSEVRDSAGRQRPFKDQPRFLGNAGLDWRSERWGTSASIAVNFVSSRREFKPAGDVRTIQPATVVDLALHQRVYRRLELFVEADNVTNEAKRESEAFVDGSSSRRREESGRVFMIGLTQRF